MFEADELAQRYGAQKAPEERTPEQKACDLHIAFTNSVENQLHAFRQALVLLPRTDALRWALQTADKIERAIHESE